MRRAVREETEIYIVTLWEVDTIGATAACLEYGGICNLGASGILLVGVALYTWAVEHDVATLPDLPLAVQ